MAIFLETQDIYRLMQRELPEGVYPDGAASGFFSTASIYAKSEQVKVAYDNMERIYDNMFPQSADEKQTDWEIKVFGFSLDAALGLAIRRQKVIDKLQTKPGIARGDLMKVIKSVIGDDKDVEIASWNCDGGVWEIGVSELGVSTILGRRAQNITSFTNPGADFCTTDPLTEFGISEADWLEMRQQAYTYSVLIYSYTLTAAEMELLELLLSQSEPARSAHVIYDGLDPADKITPPGV